MNDVEVKLFWEKVQKTRDCWRWEAATDSDGYGRFNFRGNNEKAPRIAWLFSRGEVPEGMCVLHKCDNPGCVNPNHLFIGTQKQNIFDMIGKGRLVVSRGETNGRSKLTSDEVLQIREMYANGILNQYELADNFGISQSQVSNIIRREAWRHI